MVVEDLADRDAIERYGAFLAAGRVGEEIAYGRCISSTAHDDAEIAKLAAKLGDDVDGFTAKARARAKDVLDRCWPAVQTRAALLLERGKLEARYFQLKEPTVQVRRVELPLQTRTAAVTTSDGNINVCWGSGEQVKRASYNGYYFEDLPPENADLTWMNTGKCPLLDSHNNSRVDDVLGVVVENSAFVRDGKGYATIKLGSNAPAGIKDGTLRNISIGYAVGSMKRDGEAADGTPIYTVTSYRILECSIVGVPADKGAEILRKFPAEIRG